MRTIAVPLALVVILLRPRRLQGTLLTGDDYLSAPEMVQRTLFRGMLAVSWEAASYGNLQAEDSTEAAARTDHPYFLFMRCSTCLGGRPATQSHAILADWPEEDPGDWHLPSGRLFIHAVTDTNHPSTSSGNATHGMQRLREPARP